ncbi:membrane protein [Flexivirga endophytica]|uniref:Membrane protein n=1 Tax=Flexivirga endophytica TaxID=1849103 RepID=A0A916TIY0_9MICO|nr:type II secretion system F family protein [Flexivirga endophytica]GGB47476.1 membrane protein [Flexivirga endophytica]GHB67022.1 membrane protein [Flexivirga endophytica]
MNDFMPLWAGLAVTTCFVVFLVGYRWLRSDAAEGLAVEDLVLLRGAQQDEAKGLRPLEKLASRFVPAVRRALGPKRTADLQRRINEAGRPNGMTIDSFLRRLVMWYLLTLPLCLIFLGQGNLLMALAPLGVPLLMTFGGLSGARRKRREAIDNNLPDFLDILAVTVKAGVAFRPALARVGERFGGPLGDEITIVLGQLQNGASIRQAFTGLKERNAAASMTQFVAAFLQSEELGAPLADTLNTIASDMRRESAQRMRRKAARAAPQITLVTSLILVPAVLIMVLVGIVIGSDADLSGLLG